MDIEQKETLNEEDKRNIFNEKIEKKINDEENLVEDFRSFLYRHDELREKDYTNRRIFESKVKNKKYIIFQDKRLRKGLKTLAYIIIIFFIILSAFIVAELMGIYGYV